MAIEILVKINGKSPEEFSDFFVVYEKNPPYEVEIETIPSDATIKWELRLMGDENIEPIETMSSKRFIFDPHVKVTANGRQSNPVWYRLIIKASHASESNDYTKDIDIKQNIRSIICQEYIDFNLEPPDLKEIVKAKNVSALTSDDKKIIFSAEEIVKRCAYKPWIVDRGIEDILIKVSNKYKNKIILNSTYRSPRHNAAVTGAKKSKHLSGSAIDMVTNTNGAIIKAEGIAELCRKAHHVELSTGKGRTRIIIEQNGNKIFPIDWHPFGSKILLDGTKITFEEESFSYVIMLNSGTEIKIINNKIYNIPDEVGEIKHSGNEISCSLEELKDESGMLIFIFARISEDKEDFYFINDARDLRKGDKFFLKYNIAHKKIKEKINLDATDFSNFKSSSEKGLLGDDYKKIFGKSEKYYIKKEIKKIIYQCNGPFPLIAYFLAATHLHVDNGNEVLSIGETIHADQGNHEEIPKKYTSKFGDADNARKKLKQQMIFEEKMPGDVDIESDDLKIYVMLEEYVSNKEESINKLIKEISEKNKIVECKNWMRHHWPDNANNDFIYRINFDWKYTDIVIHHSAYELESDYIKIEEMHIKNGFLDIGYHFLINHTGKIFEGRKLLFMGSHVSGSEHVSIPDKGKIGILLLGNFNSGVFSSQLSVLERPKITENQIKSIISLINKLKELNLFGPIATLGGHRDYLPDSSSIFSTFDQFAWLCPGDEVYAKLDYIRSETKLEKPKHS